MEIRDYLRQIRRFLWLVIAAPIVAGLLTGGIMQIRPSQYQADASVVVPAITAAGFSQSAASQYVDTFKDVLVSQPVLADVHQKFNIPTSELASGLSASTITPSSNIINIVLIGQKGQNLTGAVREATIDSLNAIAQPRLAQAQNSAANAQTLLTNADTAIANWAASNDNADPQLTLNGAQSQLNTEVNLLAVEIANHDPRQVATSQLITKYKAAVLVDTEQLNQYQSLANAKSAALSANDHATQEVVDAQALVTTDEQSSTVTAYNVGRLSKLSDTIKFAAIAFAIALLMLLGLLLILELMRPARRATTNVPGHGKLSFGPQQTQYTTVPTSTPVSEPVIAAASAAEPVAPPSSGSRDPWRASPAATAAPPATGGNGNGNGHSNGNGNGNGHAYVPEVEADPQRTGLGTARRR
jgi:hypothetical protein